MSVNPGFGGQTFIDTTLNKIKDLRSKIDQLNLKVEIEVDGALINQDSKVKDYQEHLEKNILKLNYKSFTQIVVLGSSSFFPFMQLKSNDRRIIIEDLLDIQIFSTMNLFGTHS